MAPTLTPSPEDDYDLDSVGMTGTGGLPVFRDEREVFLGTDPILACAATTAADDEAPDAWPPDNNDDQQVTLTDVLRYIPVFNSFAPGPLYNPRFDLNADDRVGLSDILMFIPFFGVTCTP